jgi:S-adenosylmethionine decarboxylase proenzyme
MRHLHEDPMHGLHLTADLGGCPPDLPLMTDPNALRELALAAVAEVGLHAVGELFHRFPAVAGQALPPGITGVVLLAESHLAVHTWPELGVVTLDVYVCNLGEDNSAPARRLMERLAQAFEPKDMVSAEMQRGASKCMNDPSA